MTNALYGASLVVTGLLVVALAVALLTVLVLLRRTTKVLDDVASAVQTIAHRTEPLEGAVGDVNTTLGRARDQLRAVVPGDRPRGTGPPSLGGPAVTAVSDRRE